MRRKRLNMPGEEQFSQEEGPWGLGEGSRFRDEGRWVSTTDVVTGGDSSDT